MISFTLPMAPSINHYYGNRRGGGKFIRPDGIAFRAEVFRIYTALKHPVLIGRIKLSIVISPATHARQDLDNRLKSLLDALTHAGAWTDDSQIDHLTIERACVVKGGTIKIMISEIDGT